MTVEKCICEDLTLLENVNTDLRGKIEKMTYENQELKQQNNEMLEQIKYYNSILTSIMLLANLPNGGNKK